jgi:hypothetical protein
MKTISTANPRVPTMVDKCAICGTSDSKTLALCCHPQCPARSFHDKNSGPTPPPVVKPYWCPVCGVKDIDAYMRCYHPGCPDGRDQARNATPRYPPAPRRALAPEDRKAGRVLLLVVMFAIISIIYACTAKVIGL